MNLANRLVSDYSKYRSEWIDTRRFDLPAPDIFTGSYAHIPINLHSSSRACAPRNPSAACTCPQVNCFNYVLSQTRGDDLAKMQWASSVRDQVEVELQFELDPNPAFTSRVHAHVCLGFFTAKHRGVARRPNAIHSFPRGW